MHQTSSENSAGAHVGWEEEEEEEDSYNLCCLSPQFCWVHSKPAQIQIYSLNQMIL